MKKADYDDCAWRSWLIGNEKWPLIAPLLPPCLEQLLELLIQLLTLPNQLKRYHADLAPVGLLDLDSRVVFFFPKFRQSLQVLVPLGLIYFSRIQTSL